MSRSRPRNTQSRSPHSRPKRSPRSAFPPHRSPPRSSALSFAGTVGGNTSVVGQGGTFHYTTTTPGVAEIIISRDGSNFDPGNPLNRVLRATQSAGAHTLAWDGKDNSGNDLPVGANYQLRAGLHAGEYHFPLLDAENSTLGGPTITLQNPPGGTCPFGNSACTTAFYDDRGYHTSGGSGSDVGTPGATLCGLNPEPTNHSDPATGYDSSSGQRGTAPTPVATRTSPCTGSFGDVKGLDTWTYFPSAHTSSTLNIINTAPPAPVATDDNYNTAYQTPLVTAAPGVLTNDTGTSISVSSHTNPAHGTVTQNADGSFTYTPANGYAGSDSYSYTISDGFARTSNATVNLTVQPPPGPVATDDSYNVVYGTQLVVGAGSGLLANDTGTGISVTAHTNPAHGTLTQNTNGSFTYTPTHGYSGTDSYSYTITDGFAANIQRHGQPHGATTAGPVATDDSYNVVYGTQLVVGAGSGLLANDTGTGTSVTAHTNPARRHAHAEHERQLHLHAHARLQRDRQLLVHHHRRLRPHIERHGHAHGQYSAARHVAAAHEPTAADEPTGTIAVHGRSVGRAPSLALFVVNIGAWMSSLGRRSRYRHATRQSTFDERGPSHSTLPLTCGHASITDSTRGLSTRRRSRPRE